VWTSSGDGKGNLIGDGSDEVVGTISTGGCPEEEETGEKQPSFVEELSNRSLDSGFACSCGTMEPYNRVRVGECCGPCDEMV